MDAFDLGKVEAGDEVLHASGEAAVAEDQEAPIGEHENCVVGERCGRTGNVWVRVDGSVVGEATDMGQDPTGSAQGLGGVACAGSDEQGGSGGLAVVCNGGYTLGGLLGEIGHGGLREV